MTLSSTRAAFLAALGLAAAAVGAGATVFALRADAESPPLAAQPYTLECWQDGVRIVSAREGRALQSFAHADPDSLTIENADGSRRVLKPFGDSLCLLDFTASRN